MSRDNPPAAVDSYDVRVDGHLDEHWSVWFGALAVTHEADGSTSLRCVVADQADLHGLLTKVRDLGLILISVTRIDTESPGSQEQQRSLPRAPPTSNLGSTHQQYPSSPPPSSSPQEQE